MNAEEYEKDMITDILQEMADDNHEMKSAVKEGDILKMVRVYQKTQVLLMNMLADLATDPELKVSLIEGSMAMSEYL